MVGPWKVESLDDENPTRERVSLRLARGVAQTVLSGCRLGQVLRHNKNNPDIFALTNITSMIRRFSRVGLPGYSCQATRWPIPYRGTFGSRLTSLNPSCFAWAMSSRSNGSRWISGKDCTANAWGIVTGSGRKRFAAIAASMSSGASSLPSAYLMEISQATAALR